MFRWYCSFQSVLDCLSLCTSPSFNIPAIRHEVLTTLLLRYDRNDVNTKYIKIWRYYGIYRYYEYRGREVLGALNTFCSNVSGVTVRVLHVSFLLPQQSKISSFHAAFRHDWHLPYKQMGKRGNGGAGGRHCRIVQGWMDSTSNILKCNAISIHTK